METIRAKKYHIVEVEWGDSLRTGGWRDIKEYMELTVTPTIKSVGYLLKSNRTAVTLIQSYDPAHNNMTDSITIPRSAVRKVTRLVRKE